MNPLSEKETAQAERMQAQYLASLNRRLWLLPASKRDEIRCEIGSHIEFNVAEGIFDGLSPIEATKLALAQLGRPSRFAWLLLLQCQRDYSAKDPKFTLSLVKILFFASQMSLLIFASTSSYIHSSNGMWFRDGAGGLDNLTPLGLNMVVSIPALIIYTVTIANRVSYVRRRLTTITE